MTAEGMMRDGKALQMATSHELGQNFARAFDIYFQSEEGQAELCFTSSWGASTRMVGGSSCSTVTTTDSSCRRDSPRSRRSSSPCATSPR